MLAGRGSELNISGSRLRELRENAGLSLSECARQASVSRSYLSELENGIKNDPGPPVCARLSKVLDCAISDLRA